MPAKEPGARIPSAHIDEDSRRTGTIKKKNGRVQSTESPDISVFLPVFNEEPNLLPLHAKLNEALKSLGRSAEIVYVDDGSTRWQPGNPARDR